jgi:uncharacterized protein with HEPN domain
MPSKNPAQRLSDIIENIEAIQAFTAGLDLPAFRADRKTVYAVVRALEIISEATRRLRSICGRHTRRSTGSLWPQPETCIGTSTRQ